MSARLWIKVWKKATLLETWFGSKDNEILGWIQCIQAPSQWSLDEKCCQGVTMLSILFLHCQHINAAPQTLTHSWSLRGLWSFILYSGPPRYSNYSQDESLHPKCLWRYIFVYHWCLKASYLECLVEFNNMVLFKSCSTNILGAEFFVTYQWRHLWWRCIHQQNVEILHKIT